MKNFTMVSWVQPSSSTWGWHWLKRRVYFHPPVSVNAHHSLTTKLSCTANQFDNNSNNSSNRLIVWSYDFTILLLLFSVICVVYLCFIVSRWLINCWAHHRYMRDQTLFVPFIKHTKYTDLSDQYLPCYVSVRICTRILTSNLKQYVSGRSEGAVWQEW